MFGSGVPIGMMLIIIKGAQGIIRVDLTDGVYESLAAVPGPAVRGTSGRLNGGQGRPRGAASKVGFVWSLLPGSYFLNYPPSPSMGEGRGGGDKW
jgi:hypothetical protein